MSAVLDAGLCVERYDPRLTVAPPARPWRPQCVPGLIPSCAPISRACWTTRTTTGWTTHWPGRSPLASHTCHSCVSPSPPLFGLFLRARFLEEYAQGDDGKAHALAVEVVKRLQGSGARVAAEPTRLAAPVIMAQSIKAEVAEIQAKTMLLMDSKMHGNFNTAMDRFKDEEEPVAASVEDVAELAKKKKKEARVRAAWG
jgi:hypothetical protein